MQRQQKPLWENTNFCDINYFDPAQPIFFEILCKKLKEIKISHTPERFKLEYSLILASLPEQNPTNEKYFKILESIANKSVLNSSDALIPQHHQLVAAGTDIKCSAKLHYHKTFLEEGIEEEVYISVDSISAPEIHLEINLNNLTCEGGWFDLYALRRTWDSSNLPYVVTKPSENEVKMTIDEKNYVLINLDILFKPDFSVEYFDPKLKKVVNTTNKALDIETNSMFQLTNQMMFEDGYFDEIFKIRTISTEQSLESYDDPITETDDLLIQHGDHIVLITVLCSLCKSAKDMPVQPNVINDEYLCDSCYKDVESTTTYLKNDSTQFIMVEIDKKIGCLQKIRQENPDSLKLELFFKFKELRPKKRKRFVDNLLCCKHFDLSSVVEKTFLCSINELNLLILQLRHQGYYFNQHSPVDDICFNLTI